MRVNSLLYNAQNFQCPLQESQPYKTVCFLSFTSSEVWESGKKGEPVNPTFYLLLYLFFFQNWLINSISLCQIFSINLSLKRVSSASEYRSRQLRKQTYTMARSRWWVPGSLVPWAAGSWRKHRNRSQALGFWIDSPRKFSS